MRSIEKHFVQVDGHNDCLLLGFIEGSYDGCKDCCDDGSSLAMSKVLITAATAAAMMAGRLPLSKVPITAGRTAAMMARRLFSSKGSMTAARTAAMMARRLVC